jgi:hypothetical protein
MDSGPTTEEMARMLNGDLQAFALLSRYPHVNLERCAELIPRLIVTREGVRNVLLTFTRGEASAELVNAWAWFIRAGYVPGGSGPIRPLDIEYDPAAEDLIVEIVSRLTELGDFIDGEISQDELAKMILAVSS